MVSGNSVDPALLLRFGFTPQQKTALDEIREVSPFVAECIEDIVDKELESGKGLKSPTFVAEQPRPKKTEDMGSLPTMFCGAVGSYPPAVGCVCRVSACTHLSGKEAAAENEPAAVKFFEATLPNPYNARLFPGLTATEARQGGGDVDNTRKLLIVMTIKYC